MAFINLPFGIGGDILRVEVEGLNLHAEEGAD